jgi:hypothetical protein
MGIYKQMKPETLSAIRQHHTAIYLRMQKNGPKPHDDHKKVESDEEEQD